MNTTVYGSLVNHTSRPKREKLCYTERLCASYLSGGKVLFVLICDVVHPLILLLPVSSVPFVRHNY